MLFWQNEWRIFSDVNNWAKFRRALRLSSWTNEKICLSNVSFIRLVAESIRIDDRTADRLQKFFFHRRTSSRRRFCSHVRVNWKVNFFINWNSVRLKSFVNDFLSFPSSVLTNSAKTIDPLKKSSNKENWRKSQSTLKNRLNNVC